MKKFNLNFKFKLKLKSIIMFTLILTLINTGFVAFLTVDKTVEYIQNRPVVISKDYDKGQSIAKALLTEKPMVVWFYTDWCRYCQKFAPTFKKLTKDKELKKAYAFAYVNAEDPVNEDIVKEYKVEGYPTVYLVKEGKREWVSPMDLFVPKAEDSLKTKFLAFIK